MGIFSFSFFFLLLLSADYSVTSVNGKRLKSYKYEECKSGPLTSPGSLTGVQHHTLVAAAVWLSLNSAHTPLFVTLCSLCLTSTWPHCTTAGKHFSPLSHPWMALQTQLHVTVEEIGLFSSSRPCSCCVSAAVCPHSRQLHWCFTPCHVMSPWLCDAELHRC